MKITIDHAVIKSLLLIAAKQDIRYYLNGICVDVTDKHAVLVACDGHRLLAYPLAPDAIEAPTPGQYTIPRDLLDTVKPAKAGRITMPIIITVDKAPDTPDPERVGVTIKGRTSIAVTGAVTVTGAPVDGTYPDWRRVIPRSTSGEIAQYQMDYLADFGAVCKLLGGKYSPFIHHNGSSGAVITNLGPAIGVVMPLRIDVADHPYTAPDWLAD
jgi:DNA polymerase-3 subunit beta